MSENPLITIVTIAVTAALIVFFEKRKRARQQATETARNRAGVDSPASRTRRRRSMPSASEPDQSP